MPNVLKVDLLSHRKLILDWLSLRMFAFPGLVCSARVSCVGVSYHTAILALPAHMPNPLYLGVFASSCSPHSVSLVTGNMRLERTLGVTQKRLRVGLFAEEEGTRNLKVRVRLFLSYG